MYLLDSDIWIFSLRGHAKVAENLAAHAADPKAMSVISYGELLYGAMKSARPVENAARVRRVGELFPVIDVTWPIVETFGTLKVELERQGGRADDFDLLIASTAIHLSYTLVTNNERHYRPIPGLAIENWAK
ncbi:MAG: type II toxin-antitoxin system VapC family toxin [Planctomycetia bacterium]|nr:type II toxin-antitoxin system VapC family toxin [Planctomycetia bacterium]